MAEVVSLSTVIDYTGATCHAQSPLMCRGSTAADQNPVEFIRVHDYFEIASYCIYLLHLFHFVTFHFQKTLWMLTETCELVLACKGLTR